MSSPDRHLPGTYLTDGRSLLWVVERTSADTVLVENAVSGEQVEMGDADLQGYQKVDRTESENDEQQSASSR